MNGGALSWILAPLTLPYGIAVGARNFLYDRGILRAEPLPVPVISIGNVTTGGTGKSPMVRHVARRLIESGWRVVVLTRGYGRVSDETVVLESGTEMQVEKVGDEPVELAQALPEVRVVVDGDRRRSGRIAAGKLGADVLLLDDAFQHRRVDRDLDVVLVDSSRMQGELLLPAGRRREPWRSLRRADIVVLTKADDDDLFAKNRRTLSRYSSAPVVRAVHRPVSIRHPLSGERHHSSWLGGKRVAAICGIGDPASFRRSLASLGAEVVKFFAHPDHASYKEHDLAEAFAPVRSGEAEMLVTTGKDWVRIEPFRAMFAASIGTGGIGVLEVEISIIENANLFYEAVDRVASPKVDAK